MTKNSNAYRINYLWKHADDASAEPYGVRPDDAMVIADSAAEAIEKLKISFTASKTLKGVTSLQLQHSQVIL